MILTLSVMPARYSISVHARSNHYALKYSEIFATIKM
jgi:hypothetical protein